MELNQSKSVIGVSLGGKTLLAGRVRGGVVEDFIAAKINNRDTEENVIKEVLSIIEKMMDDSVAGIGFGAPSLVDVENGIVYNVQKIKSWKKVHIKEILEDAFEVPVYVNNDANCFAIGELYFGQGRHADNLVGLILGVGVGAGIVFKKHLYFGANCGSGEYGNIPFKEHDIEYYLSESYFDLKYDVSFEHFYQRAMNKDKVALAIFEQYGYDLGEALKIILYSVDPEMIIIGGPLSKAFPFFKEAMWSRVNKFLYKHSVEKLQIVESKQENIAILGAAALYFDAKNNVLDK